MRIDHIPIAQIEGMRNAWRVDEHLRQVGHRTAADEVPVIVLERPEGGFEVLDGTHRLRALQAAGATEVPALVVGFTD